MHITTAVRDTLRVPIGGVLVVLPMFPNSRAIVTAITNGLPGGPQWNMDGDALIVGPFEVQAELRVESIEGDIAYDTSYLISEDFSSQIETLTGDVDTLTTEVGTLATSVTTLQTQVGDLDLTGINDDITTLQTGVTTLQNEVDTLSTEVAGLDLTGIDTQLTTLTGDVNTLLAGSNWDETIVGLVGDGATDEWAVFQSFVSPAESGGSIITNTDGTESVMPDGGIYLVSKTIDADPQVSMYWEGRGAKVVIPDPNFPVLTSGAAGQGIRTGGGAEGSLFRLTRRAPAINKQGFEQSIGGFCIDGSGQKMMDNFTVDTTADAIISTGHKRVVGGTVMFKGAALPAPLDDETVYFVVAVPNTSRYQVSLTLGGSPIDITTSGTAPMLWTTNTHGLRVPGTSVNSNPNDPDQDFDDKKEYTAGFIHDMDISSMPGSALVMDPPNGRLHFQSVRFLNCGLNGLDAGSCNDIVASGHWGGGGNGNAVDGGWSFFLGDGSGFYGGGGNVWSSAVNRGLDCGAMFFKARAKFGLWGSELNDWIRFDGAVNFNKGGSLFGNNFHPHGVNFDSDGMGHDRANSGSPRLQCNYSVVEYQGVNFWGNSFVRTDSDNPNNLTQGVVSAVSGNTLTSNKHGLVANAVIYIVAGYANSGWSAGSVDTVHGITGLGVRGAIPNPLVQGVAYYAIVIDANNFQVSATHGGLAITLTSTGSGVFEFTDYPTYGNWGGDVSGIRGTAPQYLGDCGGNGSTTGMIQISEGVCTAPNTKPWTGPFSAVTWASASANITWTAHPLNVGDRVGLSGGVLPAAYTADILDYYVVAVPDVNTFQVSATYGGTPVASAAAETSGTSKCFQLSSIPWNFHDMGQGAWVYRDSYRGHINIGQRNGLAQKINIGLSNKMSFEGDPNCFIELGDSTLHSGLPVRNRFYGLLEQRYALSVPAVNVVRTTLNSGNLSRSIGPYAAQTFITATGNPAGTLTLPTGLKAGFETEITIDGASTLTWVATMASDSPPLPAWTTGWTVLKLQYLPDTGSGESWHLLSITGRRGWFALTDAGSIVTPTFPDQSARFSVTLAGNRTLANPTAPVDGGSYTWRITQDATGTRTLAYGTKFKFPGGAPTLSTAAGAVDIIKGEYDATANAGAGIMYCTIQKAYA